MSNEKQFADMLAADPHAQAIVAAIAREPVAQVTAYALAVAVAELYERGVPHDEVTEILERVVVGDFRKYLVQIHYEGGVRRWMLAPSKVAIVVSQ